METNASKKRKIQNFLSLISIFIGIVLMVYMIVIEGEPGAVPLTLIIIGIGCYIFNRFNLRTQQA